jgi:hypothetical protein
MTTLHLTDAQRDTFTACGFIVVEPADVEQWSGVVTLTAACPDDGTVTVDRKPDRSPRDLTVEVCETCKGSGRVTLGRFTIPALLPVYYTDRRGPERHAVVVAPSGVFRLDRNSADTDYQLPLDPSPRPGQFVAIPEAVA